MGKTIPQEVVDEVSKWSVIDYFETFEPGAIHKVGNEYRMKEHPSFCISQDGNVWCWHSQGLDGIGPISYLRKVKNMHFRDAVSLLIGKDIAVPKSEFKQNNSIVFPFALPEKNSNNNQLYHYLKSRGVTDKVINYCIANNLLYQSKEYSGYVLLAYNSSNQPLYITRETYSELTNKSNIKDVLGYCESYNLFVSPIELQGKKTLSNVVFVGYDVKENKPAYATKRGMYNKTIYVNGEPKNKSFRQEVLGSNKQYAFAMRSSSNTNNSLHIFEAPIDAMSYASLIELYSSDFTSKNLLAIGGAQSGNEHNGKVTLPLALEEFLATNQTTISKVFIHYDNDETGLKQAQLLKNNLLSRGINCEIKLPPTGKDVNDFLKATVQKLNNDKSLSARNLLQGGR